MRSTLLFAALTLAGCPAPPENPSTGAPGPTPQAGPAAQPGQPGPAAQGGPAATPPAQGDAANAGVPTPPDGPGGPGGPPPTFEIEGEAVKVSGTVDFPEYSGGKIVVEVLRNEEGVAQPIRLHVVQLDGPGAFEFDAPKDLGAINILAYIGDAEQGPSPEAPKGIADAVTVGAEAVSGLAITMSTKDPVKPPKEQ